jgi:signal transduction histidine kinase
LRPRARLLRTLGSDLISSEKVALIELVKNSFDADATAVIIRFQGPLEQGSGSVEILDDGHGMNAATLQSAYLDIATDTKKKQRHSESGRRRVLGEKGIGRLAASRLGSEMQLVTRRLREDEISLRLDWKQFDQDDLYLDEIKIDWQAGPPSVFSDAGAAARAFSDTGPISANACQGTLLRLEKLTRSWVWQEFEDLRTALARLIRPRPDANTEHSVIDFRIFLDLPAGYESLSGEVSPPDELDTPHYKLTGSVSANGKAQLKYQQLQPPLERDLNDLQLWTNDARALESGPIEIDIEAWDRDAEALRKVSAGGSVRDFRRLLDQVAGVSVYRDGFRVLPFGELGDDWLGLDRRRVQNPTLRLSNNQVIGHVFIGADANPHLRDQSNREGLLEGTAYEDLQTIIHAALVIVETNRYTARRHERPAKENKTGLFRRFSLDEIRNALATKYSDDKRIIELVDAKSREIQEGIEQVQRVLSQYSRLATLGSLIDRIIHDGRTSVTRLKSIVRFGEKDLAKRSTTDDVKIEEAKSSLRDTAIQADLLSALFNQIEPFGGRKRGRPKLISLNRIITDAIDIFRVEATENGIAFDFVSNDLTVTVDESEILSVFVNVLQNAMFWLRTTPKSSERCIHISANRAEDESVSIIVSDSGPGVPDELRDAIFDPYFSNRKNGVGLGLSIAGDMVHALYGGQLSLLDRGPLAGATFQILLRKRV